MRRSLIYFQIGAMIARFMEQDPKVDAMLECTHRWSDANRRLLRHRRHLAGN